MDKATADRLGKVILPALVDALKAHGFTAVIEGGTFEPHDPVFHPKVVVRALDFDPNKAAFLKNHIFYGLKPEDHGRELTINREQWRLVSLRPRTKHPIVCERVSDGRERFFDITALAPLRAKGAK